MVNGTALQAPAFGVFHRRIPSNSLNLAPNRISFPRRMSSDSINRFFLAQVMGGYSRNGTNRAPRYPGSIASAMVRLGTDWIESFSRAMPTLRQHMILVTNYICMGSAGGPISLALSWGYSHLPVFRHRCCSMNTMSTLCEKQQTHFLSRVMQPIFANALRK